MATAPGIALLTLLVFGSCGCSRREDSNPSATRTSSATVEQACPLGVRGTILDVVDTRQGADVVLSAPPESVDELRRRSASAAALHGPGAHLGEGHDGQHLGAQRHGLRLTDLPSVDASSEEIDGGAVIHLSAKDPRDIEAIRQQLRQRVAIVRTGPCD